MKEINKDGVPIKLVCSKPVAKKSGKRRDGLSSKNVRTLSRKLRHLK